MPQDKTQRLAESAAREMANQIWSIALSNAYGKPERDVIGEITTLITQVILAAEQRDKEAQLMTSEVWGLIQGAEQRGIERAVGELERLEVWQHGPEGHCIAAAYECMSPADCIPHVRALAQGGE